MFGVKPLFNTPHTYAALCAVILAVAFAAPANANPPIVTADPQMFWQQREAIMADIAAGERYRELAAIDRVEVMRALDRIEALLGEKDSIAELTPAQRAELMNAQEIANTLLTTAAADSRLICTRERPVGSRMLTTTCKTVAERRSEREESQELMRTRRINDYAGPRG
jgi:hypothetical protein